MCEKLDQECSEKKDDANRFHQTHLKAAFGKKLKVKNLMSKMPPRRKIINFWPNLSLDVEQEVDAQ